jgi:SAM-dependent methyltransferase
MNNSQDVSLDLIIKNKSILHFAPDKCLETFLKSIAKLYKTADLLTEGYNYHNIDYNLDMSKMSKIKDSEFDCVIAIDVLEHVPNDVLAVRETYRILKNGGYCIFMIPQKDGLETTFEDSSITDPDKRKEIFGQWDHLRIYGSDFEKTLKNAGFDVVVKDAKDLNSKIVKKFVLHPPIESEHPLATNHRKVYFGRKD